MISICKHCGVEIKKSYYVIGPEYVHVTRNGDTISSYCQLQVAEPGDEDT